MTDLPASPSRTPLLNLEVIRRDFTSAVFADSHSGFEHYLGAGILYYALGQLVRSQVSVCIGSGGGFVPSLMRRAQLDAGIAPSVTFLVDANLPDLAFGSPGQTGGWMTEENAFLEREDDIVVLTMLSVDAAATFAASGIRIDHLHIDGDHSTRGLLADWQAYAPLLSEHAVVSLHDLRLPSIAEALRQIRTARPDLEMLSFPEVGAGTAVLRPVARSLPARRGQTLADLADPGRKIALDPSRIAADTAASQHRARFERWSYLETDAYRSRYRFMAGWIDDPDLAVVEIGGFPNSIVHSLTQAKSLHMVEPYVTDDFVAEARAAAAERGIALYLHEASLAGRPLDPAALPAYALVILGLDITAASETEEDFLRALSALVELVAGARVAALELPRYAPSLLTFDWLCRILAPEIRFDMTLDLSRDPVADSHFVHDDRAIRRMLLLEGMRRIDPTDPAVQAMLAQAARELHQLRNQQTTPADPRYRPGDVIDFSREGESDRYCRAGWLAAEARHRWMTGSESRLSFLPDLDERQLIAAGGLELRMAVRPLTGTGRAAQGCVIRANGHQVFTGEFSGPDTLACRIPAEILLRDRLLQLSIQHPDAARPSDVIPGSKDRKLLSFAVTTLQLGLAGDG